MKKAVIDKYIQEKRDMGELTKELNEEYHG